MPGPIYYTVTQAARKLAMLESEALRLIATSGIRPCEAGARLLFCAADIDALIADQEKKAAEKRQERETSRSGRVVIVPPAARKARKSADSDEEGSDSGLFDKLKHGAERGDAAGGAKAGKSTKTKARSRLDDGEGSTSGLFDQIERSGR